MINDEIAKTNFCVKNLLEFIDKTKDISFQESEILISFDVCSLFPSVPIPQTLEYLRKLLKQNSFSDIEVDELVLLTDLCMKQNYFQVEGHFYEQKEGAAMGNPLSSFLPNLFMTRLEVELSDHFEYFRRIWLRYVDDIFAIFDTKKANIEEFVSVLNNKFETETLTD